MERRALGKNLQEFKRQQEEENIKRQAEERRKEKAEAAQARERVRAQIAQDRAEKAAKFNQLQQEEEDKRIQREAEQRQQQAAEAERLAAARSSKARVQFRLPDGRSQTHAFEADAPLSEVYAYVSDQISHGYGNSVNLSTTFPRRQLNDEPKTTPLRDLSLAPSGTIMILPQSQVVGSSGSMMDLVWLILTPITVLWSVLQSFFVGGNGRKRQGEPNTEAQT